MIYVIQTVHRLFILTSKKRLNQLTGFKMLLRQKHVHSVRDV